MGTLLQVSADACAAALARGDSHVVADVGDLPRELVELVALSYFKFKLTRREQKNEGEGSNNALPLPTSSNHIPALRALAESDALSPTSLLLSDAAMTLSRGAFLYLNLASHSLVHLDINGCGWLDNLDFTQELPQLRCLSLRGCTGLRSESLAALACPCEDDAHDDAHTGRRRGGRGRRGGNKGGRKVYNPPPRLEALDLSDCAAVDDAAGPHLARLPRSLRSLNLSGCGVGNLILDYLTYRGRLTMWRRERGGVETPSGLDDGCTATDLRLRRTRVSDAGLVHLKTLGRDVELLDLSECAGVSAGALAELAGSLGMSTSTSRPGVLVGVGAEEDRDACACAGACESSNVCESSNMCESSHRDLAQEGWRAFLCAVREEEIREEDQRVAALEAAERAERDAIAAILTGAAFMPSVVAEDDGDIPMFPIDAPPMYAYPSGGESPPHQVRRVSYLID